MKKGNQQRIPLPGKLRQTQPIIGGYNWLKDTIAWLLPLGRNSQSFILWLEHLLLTCYPTQFVVLVLDNASIHHSAMTRAAFALFEERLLVVYLPPHSPNLNAIERFWRHLKDRVCANKFHANMDALRDAIVNELNLQNDPSYRLRFQVCK